MKSFIIPRLSIMMFLQYFTWGAWYVTAPRYLGTIGFKATDYAWTYSVGPIAGMISPLFVGMIADRFFATQRVLGIMHILGAVVMTVAIMLMKTGDVSPAIINLIFFAYMLCYFPTLSLTNTLAMHNIEDSEKQFPAIRVFGTIGWIIAGVVLGWLVWGGSINMFYLAAGSAFVLGAYCLTLPHTPPPLAGQKASIRELLGLDALVLLKRRSFLIFIISSLLICAPLAFYYQLAERAVTQAGLKQPPTKMAFGQVSEIFFMLLMPFFFKRLGVKWMLLVGMGAWVLRYALFAVGAPESIAWMMIGGIVLHGVCYDFFFVTGQIYTDKIAPASIRGQAQGMLVLFTIGLGMLIGAQVAGKVEQANTPQETRTFNEDAQAIAKQIEVLKKKRASGGQEAGADVSKSIAQLEQQQKELSLKALQAMNWRNIWAIPAVAAGVIFLLFALMFKDDVPPNAISEQNVVEAAATDEYP